MKKLITGIVLTITLVMISKLAQLIFSFEFSTNEMILQAMLFGYIISHELYTHGKEL